MGIRQLKMQVGCDCTAGRAVMVYSGEDEVDAVLMAEVVVVVIPLIVMTVTLDVEDRAMARAIWRERTRRSFMMIMMVVTRVCL